MVLKCLNCGTEYEEHEEYCKECGIKLPKVPKQHEPSQDGDIIWAVFGFLIPIVGIVFFFLWKKERPIDAKYVGIGAAIPLGFFVVWFILTQLLRLVVTMTM